MPKHGTSTEYLANVEDRIAAIIMGRYALIDLEAMIVGSMRMSPVSRSEQERILQMLSEVRRAVDLGHEFAKRERGRY